MSAYDLSSTISDSRPQGTMTGPYNDTSTTPQPTSSYSQANGAVFLSATATANIQVSWDQPSNNLQLYSAAGKVDVWTVVGKSLLHTTDHGQHWTQQYVAQSAVTSLVFPDLLHGWIVDHEGTVFVTHDGGAHWSQYQSPEPALKQMQALDFLSPNIGWAVSGQPLTMRSGPAYQTSDGGKTWTRIKIDLNKVPFPFGPWTIPPCDWYKAPGVASFTSTSTGWVVCPTNHGSNAPHSGAFFYETTDGSASWVLGPTAPQVASRDVGDNGVEGLYLLSDNKHGWYSSAMRFTGMSAEYGTALLRTTSDGGRSWRSVAVGYGSQVLGELHFVSPTHGYATVWAYHTEPGSAAIALLETQDGGATWTPIYVSHGSYAGTALPSAFPLHFFDANRGIGAGAEMEPGAISITSDGGQTWHRIGSASSACWPALLVQIDDSNFADPEHGWVVARCLDTGDGGTSQVRARTTDGGRSWTSP